MQDDGRKVFIVAGSLCLICSFLVSTAAVTLRPRILENQRLDMQKNILQVADIYDPAQPVGAQFNNDWRKMIVLGHRSDGSPNGNTVSMSSPPAGIDPDSFDPRKAARIDNLSTEIKNNALPQITRRAYYSFVYEITGDDPGDDRIVLPIYGKGLWSTLYGFIALKPDCTTIAGITFYEHGETPGLGGEVDKPDWKASWKNKLAFTENNFSSPSIRVVKGKASGQSQIDGLSGATITSRGVNDLVRYWLGPDAFGPYLDRKRRAQKSQVE